ncbi:hypothetical protein H2203_000329 [Taxawa tesnikishii (nom. ined.)]|nr:hypothetical protein H2203_000329 [Dothideales sp. JES 119]
MAVSSAARDSRVEPKSPHVADPALQPFLATKFDPADYLNATLPSLAINNPPRDASAERASLADLSSQTQTLLSQLNAQTSRLSSTLTQLTDDILRSGSRLAYEVEILRGETSGLSDALTGGLQEEIKLFVPSSAVQSEGDAGQHEAGAEGPNARAPQPANREHVAEPEYIVNLRTLTLVRSRLESVIKIFGEAMQWPLAPSELSIASSLISVSAPDTGSADNRNREEKGREYAQKLRDEISSLIENAPTLEEGMEAATQKIDELRELAMVWKGTAEEKARTRFVESLMKPIEEAQKALARKVESQRRGGSGSRGVDYRYDDSSRAASEGGYGFIKNLQRIKGDIYLE